MSIILVLTLALLMLTLAAQVRATAQIPKILVDNGTEHMLFSTSLESWFGPAHPRPDNTLHMVSTACWRGYQGRWDLRDETLWLVALFRCHSKDQSPLAKFFPGQTGPIKADWYTGSFKIPQGWQTRYVHMGFATQYERWLYIEIEKGRVVRRTVVTPPPEDPRSGPGPSRRA
ncbi:MAG: hypothetical protein PHV85_05510 [Desulfovibrionaceae bacterium]|nr:hypothetical protein [Desulfovibrionaceae bacterium]